MAGLAKLCKLYGRLTSRDENGSVVWVWDYVKDEAVHEKDMPEGSERWKASEKAKYERLRKQQENPARW